MNVFDRSKLVEAEAMLRLKPFLEETQGRFVMTEKGKLSRFLQETVGDILFNDRRGRLWGVEVKAEKRSTGNLFLEIWSNRNLRDAQSHADRGQNPGWMLKTRADLIFYLFLDTDHLVILNTFHLKNWAFVQSSDAMTEQRNGTRRSRAGRIYDFEQMSPKCDQMNDTWGCVVPIATLVKEMRSPPVIIRSVRQLELDLFGGEAA